MASLVIPCPRCGHLLHLPDRSLVGRNGRCPACELKFPMEERLLIDESEARRIDDERRRAEAQRAAAERAESEQRARQNRPHPDTHRDPPEKWPRPVHPGRPLHPDPFDATADRMFEPDPSLADTQPSPQRQDDDSRGGEANDDDSAIIVEVDRPTVDSIVEGQIDVPEQLGRYRVLELIGQGSMGAVYRAHDSELDRHVALKVPSFTDPGDQDEMERFYREARAAATLHHPNICQVFDIGTADGCHFIAMQYIKGNPLTTFIKQEKPQPVRKIASTIRKLAQAMQQAHNKGLVHRDLKPDNIMIDERGEPIIMDFGLVRLMNEDDRLTNSGAIVGSPAYMSPEQVAGETADVGPPSDIFSLGVIAYELLTRRRPFRGNLSVIFDQIEQVDPIPPSELRPDIDSAFESICLRMMAKKVADRFASMGELADAINRFLKDPAASTRSNLAQQRTALSSETTRVAAICPDEAAARWILESGGNITVETDEANAVVIRDPNRLPTTPFRVVEASLEQLGNVDDEGVRHLSELDSLLVLRLSETGITDAGLACLNGLIALQELKLSYTKVTDAGLKHLKALKALKQLDLTDTEVSDAGLSHVKWMGRLQFLGLYGTTVTDAGLKTLAGVKNLRFLGLTGTQMTDAGVTRLKKVLRHCVISR